MIRDVTYRSEAAGLGNKETMKLYQRFLDEERQKDICIAGMSLIERVSLGKAESRAWDRVMEVYMR